MGRIDARNASPYRRAKSWERFGELTPYVAAGRGQKTAGIAALETLMEFRAGHHEAKRRWTVGERAVRFPTGTYWMRVHHGAACDVHVTHRHRPPQRLGPRGSRAPVRPSNGLMRRGA